MFPKTILFVCVVVDVVGLSQLGYFQSVSPGMGSGSHKVSQGGEDHQLQYILEERPRLLRHLTSFPSRNNVGKKMTYMYVYIYLKALMMGQLSLHCK